MLSLLHIENIAVISQADITFDQGFNVLTGETGAGKSIVIDSIGAIMGERTSRDLIRTGAKSARVSALFRDLPALPWFEEQGMGPDENGELLIERSIQADGKNACRVNGRPLLVTQLRELGQQLVNVHGQHDGQQLLDEECHLGYLDSFGGTQDVLEAFSTAYAQVRELRRERDKLQMDDGEKARRMDTLTYQIEELEKAELREGEDEELSQRREVLRNAERLTDAVDGAWQALTGGEDGEGAVSLLMEAGDRLAQGGRYSEGLRELSEKAEQLRCDADDLAELVRDLRGTLDFYPGELDEIEERLDRLYRLKKKYGGTVEEDMPKVRFQVEFAPKDAPDGMDATGMDTVRFLMSANLGEALKPINRIASGGELSRIMLALKNVLAETEQVSTLIFDEVDTGVSGRAAVKVARKLFEVSKGRQVLCVTHLPQIAAMGDVHFSVEKGEADGRTFTRVERLDRPRRREELARLSGGQATAVMLEGAEELLATAQDYKTGAKKKR
ncbi:MAG: DNA repair protein RecN [Oscillospiraceae bacterium]|nr:DNA repair protein RecN [Oscillospiraceae bacterium]